MVKEKEIQLEIFPTEENRTALNKEQAKLKTYLHLEKEYQKQKAEMRWFKDKDRNTIFFHAYVKGMRRKMQDSEIQSM